MEINFVFLNIIFKYKLLKALEFIFFCSVSEPFCFVQNLFKCSKILFTLVPGIKNYYSLKDSQHFLENFFAYTLILITTSFFYKKTIFLPESQFLFFMTKVTSRKVDGLALHFLFHFIFIFHVYVYGICRLMRKNISFKKILMYAFCVSFFYVN